MSTTANNPRRGVAKPVGAPKWKFRRRPRREDIAAVRALAAATGVFTPAEEVIAGELVEERLDYGAASGYHFVFADVGGVPIGYCVWGPIPMTASSYDLYWIAVDPTYQGSGVGRALLEFAERAIAERGGRRVYIETSSRERYARTRRFYRRAGYRRAATFADFYAEGDDKVVFCKVLPAPTG